MNKNTRVVFRFPDSKNLHVTLVEEEARQKYRSIFINELIYQNMASAPLLHKLLTLASCRNVALLMNTLNISAISSEILTSGLNKIHVSSNKSNSADYLVVDFPGDRRTDSSNDVFHFV